MSRILGTILSVGQFFKNEAAEIIYDENQVFQLSANRKYIIPDYQREIRWKKEHLIELLSDISRREKFLGNIILNKRSDLEYEVIDGQQRITTLLMTIYYIKSRFNREIDILNICELEIENFDKFDILIRNNFEFDGLEPDDKVLIEKSDVFNQRKRYIELWNVFESVSWLQNADKCADFLSNIRRSKINLIVNTNDTDNYSIGYFLDVNLKGVKLDTEDIFKGYLFSQDSGQSIRDEWKTFKMLSFKLNNFTEYPITKLLEHFLDCDLYKNNKYRNIQFKEDFTITEVEVDGFKHYTGEHIIKVIRNNDYMLKSLKSINKFLEIILDVIYSESPSQNFKELFSPSAEVDSDEITIIHNFIKKIMLDKNIVPRILIMKYVTEILFDRSDKMKSDYRKIYGVYLLAVMFTVFESEKDVKKVLGVVKDLEWYTRAVEQSKNYFARNKISKSRITAQYKLVNSDGENHMFRCKSLATIYNFFEINNNVVKIKKGKLRDLRTYISDSERFSIEHFIINDGGGYYISGNSYKYPSDVRKYSNSIFNFIFISRGINHALENYTVDEKICLLDQKIKDDPKIIECEFSKMIIDKCRTGFSSPTVENPDETADVMEEFYSNHFIEEFSLYALDVIKEIGAKLGAN